MNPHSNPQNAQQPAGPSVGLDDIYFTAFRHKWVILICLCLGLIGAAVVRLLEKPMYVSHVKLFVRYVINDNRIKPGDQDSAVIRTGAAGVLAAETEILNSLDVAKKAAEVVGPERILAAKGGGTNLMDAAGIVSGGIVPAIPPGGGDVMVVYFLHPDSTVVQPVLSALTDAYLQKHTKARTDAILSESYYSQKLADLRRKLSETEEELKKLLTDARVIDIAEAKKTYSAQIEKLKGDLLAAKAELYTRKATLGADAEALATNDVATANIPAEKLETYATLLATMEELRKRERAMFTQNFTEEHPQIKSIRESVAELKKKKEEMEKDYRGLALGEAGAPGIDRTVEIAQIRALSSKIAGYEHLLKSMQDEALNLLTIEPAIRELMRRQADETKELDFVYSSLEKARSEDTQGSRVTGINVLEEPTPPIRAEGKTKKLMMAVFGGLAALGLGIAALLDFVVDRTVKRSADVRRHMKQPFFLAIPNTTWEASRKQHRLPFGKPQGNGKLPSADSDGAVTNVTPPWDPAFHLRQYSEGLRERLIVHFEVRGINHKPKLVGVTSCGAGAGVTTLASGLAVALSKTGDGNVLLVDMSGDHGETHSFYKGNPGCGLADVLEPEVRDEAKIQDNLYLASLRPSDMPGSAEGDAAKLLPSRFNKIMPQLKASDYDYIIFDMPPVTPTSVTPRLAATMDMVLLVLEAEKTFQPTAAHAGVLLAEARANAAVVLNKCRKHVPSFLSEEL